MKVLVTGANGFIGRHVVASFLRGGHDVRALVRPSASLEGLAWAKEVETARADLRVSAGLERACADVDAVVHIAARMGGSEAQQFETTVVGTERLLRAAAGSRIVLASSYAVYDWSAVDDQLTEESPLVAGDDLVTRGPYTVAKVWQERVARRMATEDAFELTVLRPGFVWGRGHVVLSGMGQRLRGLFVVFGCSTLLPLTYVENCADAFVAATLDDGARSETFNVVDDEPVTARRYTEEYLRRAGTGGRVICVPYGLGLRTSRVAEAVATRVFPNGGDLPDLLVPKRFEAQFKPLAFPNTKIRARLGWRPRVPFEEALQRSYGT
jgi:2-alkyl-3-oxoalkanoate reductase